MGKIENISFENVTFDSGFWKSRYDLNREVSLESVYRRFEETGRFDALRFRYEKGISPYPHIFFDSDVAKWIEAVGYLVQKNGGYEKEQAVIDALVCDMAANQKKSGYLNSHFIQIEPENAFSNRDRHELYCAGHLIEAAIAYGKATGKHAFLDVMKKYVACIEKAFVIQKTAAFRTGGHEEIELALLKLFDYTGERRYLDLALYFINERGKTHEANWERMNDKYDQSEMPVRNLMSAEGHAVRAVYLYTAMCEAYLRTGDEALHAACLRLFEDITERKMYLTGGIGSSALGEAFTVPYDLPNLEAYTESCAVLGLGLFLLALQKTALDHRFADVMERMMYNNMLSSTSLDGKSFFYENELEIHLAAVDRETCVFPHMRPHLPARRREEVFGCSCCPPNINRIFARLGDFFFSETEEALIVQQYAALTLKNDRITLQMKTDYPESGTVHFVVTGCRYREILLRRPEWCDRYTVDGAEAEEKDGYLVLHGADRSFTVNFDMQPYFVEANPQVRADNGRVALCRGPVVYCLERADNPYELNAISLEITAPVTPAAGEGSPLPDLCLPGFVDPAFPSLYRKAEHAATPVTLRFRPYYTFANREACDMLVWVRKKG